MSQTLLYALGIPEGEIKNTLVLMDVRVVRNGFSKELTLELSFSIYPLCQDHSYLLHYGNLKFLS